MKVLVCDDSRLTRNFFEMVLKTHLKLDQIVMCTNGLEGIKILEQITFDLIICDYEMDTVNGNGIDVFNYAYAKHPQTHFYMISGLDIAVHKFLHHRKFKFFLKYDVVNLMQNLEVLKHAFEIHSA